MKQSFGKSLAESWVSFSVRRKPFIHTITVMMVLLGILSYMKLPQEIFPAIAKHQIVIQASYPGTSAETFDDIITSRIEDAVRGLTGVTKIESLTRDGFCTVTLTVDPKADIDDLLFRVRDAIERLRPEFPEDMTTPSVQRVVVRFPLLTLSISGTSEQKLQQVAENVQRDIQTLKNISLATINGKAEPEFHIYLNEDKLNALGITPPEVVADIRSLVNNRPLGEIKEWGNHLFITTHGGPHTIKQWRQVILHINGKKLYLSRIAVIKNEMSEQSTLSHFDGQRNISLTVFKTAEGSSIELSKKIRSMIPRWERQYKGLHFAVFSDLSTYIKNRLITVKSSAILGIILVTLCLYLFMDGRIALVVVMGLPTTFLLSFVYLAARGETINMISLFSFLMALGMAVDDAIVIGENIYRHMEDGEERVSAAITGTTEVLWPVAASTFTTVAAFIPLLLIRGDMGQFLSIIPVFVSTVLLASLLEATFILPVHAVELFKVSESKGMKGQWLKFSNLYERSLLWSLRHKIWVVGGFLLLLAVSLFISTRVITFTLLPSFDTDQIYVRGKLGARCGLEETEKVVTKIEKRIMKVVPKSDLKSVATDIGISFNDKMEFDFGKDLFQVFVNLKRPAPQNWVERWIYPIMMVGMYQTGTRRHTSRYLEQQIRKALSGIHIERLEITRPKAGIVRADIDIGVIMPHGKRSLGLKAVHILEDALRKIKGVHNVSDDYDPGKLELELRVNDLGRQLGITEAYLASILSAYYLNPEVARIMKGVKDDILIRTYLLGKDNLNLFNRLRILVPGTKKLVYLRDVVNIKKFRGRARIWKENGLREVRITGSIDKHVTTSDQVMSKIAPVFKKISKLGIRTEIRGERKVAEDTLIDLARAAVIACLGIFLVLLLLFNAWTESLIVLVAVPFSFIGVVLGHLIMGLHLSIPSLLGFVGLAGVAVNDAIIMVDFIKRHREEARILTKDNFYNMVVKAAAQRLRPIMLTSITTILSLVTLIFFATGQAKILSPMANAFGFGLAIATVVNLFLIPVLYTMTIYRGFRKEGSHAQAK